MNFGSNTDASLKNLNYEFSKTRGGGSAQIISANFQYTMNATLFGNRIYEFSNLVFVPSYSLGKMNPSVSEGNLDQLKTDDFEIAGLYAVASVTDNLDLTTNTYRKTITGNTVLRESRLIINQLKYGGPYRRSPDAKMRFPALANTSLSVYVLDNADEIDHIKPTSDFWEKLETETDAMLARTDKMLAGVDDLLMPETAGLSAVPSYNFSTNEVDKVKFGSSLESANNAARSLGDGGE